MEIVTAYRVGDSYELEARRAGAEPVTLVLEPGVTVRRSGAGDLLLFGPDAVYGLPVRAALKLGWCHLQDGVR